MLLDEIQLAININCYFCCIMLSDKSYNEKHGKQCFKWSRI